MNIKMLTFSRGLMVASAIMFASLASAVTVTGSGSTIVINKIGGFDGVDGANREAVFVAAAQVWADILVSPVSIVIDAQFSSSLYCVSNSATLGSAGPLSTYFSSGAESFGLQSNVWYPTALINAHYGSDYFPSNADIDATFNADIGDADCLSGSGWYYGMDGNTPSGFIDFYEVVLHELGHGLGILSLVNSDGSYSGGVVDIFSTFLRDQDSATDWTAMNNSQRGASLLDTGNLVWNGAGVTSLAGDLSAGVNGGNVQMYAPSTYEGGSSVSHFDTALTPNELMEPQYTGNATYNHSVALLEDIGWTIYEPSNNVPSITGQSALSVDEDNSLVLSLNDLTVSDSDNSYPADFTLTVNSGSFYSVSGNTITPDANYNGTLTVPVTVNDGTDDSASFNLSVSVNAINDVPQITGQNTLQVNEDNSLELTIGDLTITDPDDSSFTLTVNAGSNYSVSGNTVTPNTDFNGTLTVPVTVSDGEADSASFNLSVSVLAQNDVPVVTSTPTVTVDEDTTYTFSLSEFGVSDVDSASFVLDILPGTYYSDVGNAVTPDAHFNGTLSVNARVFDGSDYSNSVSFDVTVNSVNDIPVISAQSTLFVDEDSSLLLQLSDFSITDPDDSSFTLTVSTGANYSVTSNTITPDSDFNGTLTVPVIVNDGEADSATYNASITVNALNDAPVIVSTPSLSVAEDASLVISIDDFTVTDVDSANFVLTAQAGENYSLSGNTLTPAANFNGTLSVDVDIADDKGSSASTTISVAVTPVNDAPVITGQNSLSINEDSSLTLSVSDLTITDVDSSVFTLSAGTGANYTLSGNTVTPAAEYSGSLTIPVTVSDGTDTSASYDVIVLVNVVNDKPVITQSASITIAEDSNYDLSLADLTIVDADSTSFTLDISTGAYYGLAGATVTPDADFNGMLTVPVRVFDGLEYSDTVNVTIQVTAVNDAPVLNGTLSTSATFNEAYSATFSATDIDSADLQFSVSSAHDWLSIDNNGVLSGTPGADDLGSQTVTVNISDGLLNDSQTFTLTVNDATETDVQLQVSASDALAAVASTVSFYVDLDNAGPAAFASGSVAITLPDTSQVSQLDARCEITDANTLTCAYAQLATNDQLAFNVTATEQGSVTVAAIVTATQTDTFADNNRADTTVVFASTVSEPSLPLSVAQSEHSNAAAVADIDHNDQPELWLANDLAASEQRYDFAPDFTGLTVTDALAWNGDAQDILVRDLNGDGLADLVVANLGANAVYLASTAGVFGEPQWLGSSDSVAVVSTDVNNDQLPDLIFANTGANSVYLNAPSGQFTLAQSLGSADSAEVAVIDYNRDGYADVVFANRDDDDLVYLNNGADQSSGVFNNSAVLLGTVLTQSAAIQTADFNADGTVSDIIVGRSTADNTVSLQVYRVQNAVAVTLWQVDAGDVVAIAEGDYNGDGLPDIAVVNAQDVVQLYQQNAGSFELAFAFIAENTRDVVLAPINDDFKADLVLARGALDPSLVYLSELAIEDESQAGTVAPVDDSADVQEVVVIVDSSKDDGSTQVTVSGGSFSGFLLLMGLLIAYRRRV